MLHMMVLHYHCGSIPCRDVKRLVLGSRYQIIERTQAAIALHTQLGIGVTQIIQNLELTTDGTPLSSVHVRIHKVLDATVGTLCNLEIHLEDKVVINLLGHDITTVAALGSAGSFHLEAAILYAPSLLRECGQLGASPSLCGLSVPQKFPTLTLLLLGEHIVGALRNLRFGGGHLLLCYCWHHGKQQHDKYNLFHLI